MASPTGPDANDPPPGGAPRGQPGWNAPPPSGYDPKGYSPAPSYSGGPAPADQRPGMVTAAGIIGIAWGAFGLLLGLLVLGAAFSLFGAGYGLLLLLSVALSGILLHAGIQVIQSKSPRLLLLLSYVSIGLTLLMMIWGAAQGASIFSYLLECIILGVIVFLLLNPQSKQYYAARGISY